MMINALLGMALQAMAAFAADVSGLDRAPLPKITYATHCEIVAYAELEVPTVEFCRLAEDSMVMALYDDHTRTMLIPKECKGMPTVLCEMAFIHEYTHHLQNVAGLFKPIRAVDGCLGPLEPLAYKVGNAWVTARGHPELAASRLDIMMFSACGDDYGRRNR